MKNGTSHFERKELKYLMTISQKDRFMKAVDNYITPDQFPRYSICNLYMDTPDYRLIRQSMEKPTYKEKMRLRSYGAVSEGQEVFVELKKKYKGTVYKRRIKMPHRMAMDFLKGKVSIEGQIENEIDYFLKFYRGISPAMYISYDREAFRGLNDPVLRITLDDNILWRDKDLSLSLKPSGLNLLDTGQVLMEIKCANSMPLWLVRALTDSQIYKTSFSKYGKAYSQKTTCTAKKASGI